MTEAAPDPESFEIFLVGLPGLEGVLLDEALALGFAQAKAVAGGVSFRGDWAAVQRANLSIRGASRVLARIAEFRALHLAQLDKRSRKVEWAKFLRPDVSVSVEASAKRSRIYHTGAIRQRIEGAIRDSLGCPLGQDEAGLVVRVRMDNDMCTISLDTSGDPLHRRGFKQAVNKAPMRETMAAQFLYACGYDGRETVLDPMCGSGTFVIEAAEIAQGLLPGRGRRFAFEALPRFDAEALAALRQAGETPPAAAGDQAEAPVPLCFGSDRDAGAVSMSVQNAERAGVASSTRFIQQAISDLQVPDEATPGLVIVNPPYGDRIGDKKKLQALYGSFGKVMRERFTGWRVALVTDDKQLARSTGLRFRQPTSPIPHGGLKVRLYQTDVLA